jgi:hypothetical protein
MDVIRVPITTASMSLRLSTSSMRAKHPPVTTRL